MAFFKRFTAIFTSLAIALTTLSAWSTKSYAADKVYTMNYSSPSVTTDQIVLSNYIRNYTKGISIDNYSSLITFTNDGVVNVSGGSFNMGLATFQNNGTFTFTGSNATFSVGYTTGKFINDGTATIKGVYNFSSQQGTSFINNGTLFLEDISNPNLTGFVNNGVIVIPDEYWNSTIGLAFESKNTENGRVYTKTQYENRSETYMIYYDLNSNGYIANNDANSVYYEWSAADAQDITLADPAIDGYEFLGWTGLDITEPAKNFTFSSSVRQDVTVTAHWEPIVYNIIYDLDGGSFYSGQTPNYTYVRGQQAGLLIPHKTGYTFTGWTDTDKNEQVSSGNNIYYLSPQSLGDRHFKANFIANSDTKYSVICYYQNIDGTYEEIKNLFAGETNSTVSVSSENYIKDGFSFDGENSNNITSGTITADNSLELKLYYNRNKYIVTYKSQDGSQVLWTTEKYYEDHAGDYNGETPTKQSDDDLYSYEFTGWARYENLDFGIDNLNSLPITDDICFYAAFKKIRDESIVVIKWEDYTGFNKPEQTEIRLDNGADYTVNLTLENENYYVGTKEWHLGFKQAHIYWYDPPTGEHGVDFNINKENFDSPVVLTIPNIQHDIIIKVEAHYHDEHDYAKSDDKIIENGNCVTDSIIRHFCYKCGKTYDETISANGHVTNNTFESDKVSHWKTCLICGDAVETTVHTPNEGVVTHEPTHYSTGTKTYSCTVCGYITEREILPVIPHNAEGDWKYIAGTHYKLCSCGEKLETAEHTPDNGTVTVNPTYYTEGKIEYHCTVCEYLVGEFSIAPFSHIIESEWQSELSGHWQNCECGEKHSFGEHISDGGIETKPATYTEKGKKVYSCTICGYVLKTEDISMLNHKGITIDCEWAADESGHWIDGCGCGERHEFSEHISDEGTVTLHPTDTESGEIEYRCTVCNCVIETEEIPALGTDMSEPSKPEIGIPFIKNEIEKNGWELIKAEAIKANEGSTVVVNMNGETVVPGDVIDTINGRDVTLVFDIGNGIAWSVNGMSVTAEKTDDVDFSVKKNTQTIPIDIVNNITGEKYSLQISIAYNGEFGFTAVLLINLGSENAGFYAKLYYYSEKTLEFIEESEIAKDGAVRLPFTHASDYLIVIDKKTSAANPDENKPNDSDTEDNPKTGITQYQWQGIMLIASLAAVAGSYTLIVKKKKENN